MRQTRYLAATVGVLAAALIVPAAASAAGTMSKTGSTLVFTAGNGDTNNVDVSTDGSGHILISDTGATITPDGTVCVKGVDDNTVDCGVPSTKGYSAVSLVLGDQADTASFENELPLGASAGSRRADGGPGNDSLNGSQQADTLIGGPDQDTLTGYGGGDTLEGDAEADTIDATGSEAGTDTVDAGAGDDTIYATDNQPDQITCGDDTDQVDATDPSDAVAADCEKDGNGDPFVHATATTGSATVDSATAATVHGTANPQGISNATAYFEYGTDTTYGHSTTPQQLTADSNDQPQIADIENLTEHTTYHYRLVVQTQTGRVNGADATFTTDFKQTGPIVQTQGFGELPGGAAQGFNGTIFVKDPPAHYHYEWGLDKAYGVDVLGAQTITQAGQTNAPSSPFNGAYLPGGRTLHARLVATDGTGTAHGKNVTFTRPTVAPIFLVPVGDGRYGGEATVQTAAVQNQGPHCSKCVANYKAEPTKIDFPAELLSHDFDSQDLGTGLDITGGQGLPDIPATAHMEYGLSSDYGHQTPEVTGTGYSPTPNTAQAGFFKYAPSSNPVADVTFHLTGLTPGTVYHARIDSTTYGGFAHSPDLPLITPPGNTAVVAPVSGKKATVSYTCETANACKGSATVQTIPTGGGAKALRAATVTPGKPVVLANGNFKVPSHHKGKVKLKLTKKGRKKLKHKKKLKAQIIYRSKSPTGKTLTTATVLTLKR